MVMPTNKVDQEQLLEMIEEYSNEQKKNYGAPFFYPGDLGDNFFSLKVKGIRTDRDPLNCSYKIYGLKCPKCSKEKEKIIPDTSYMNGSFDIAKALCVECSSKKGEKAMETKFEIDDEVQHPYHGRGVVVDFDLDRDPIVKFDSCHATFAVLSDLELVQYEPNSLLIKAEIDELINVYPKDYIFVLNREYYKNHLMDQYKPHGTEDRKVYWDNNMEESNVVAIYKSYRSMNEGALNGHKRPDATWTKGEPLPVLLDSEGIPWDSRIHTSAKSKIKSGKWQIRRGVGLDVIDRVKAELKNEPWPVKQNECEYHGNCTDPNCAWRDAELTKLTDGDMEASSLYPLGSSLRGTPFNKEDIDNFINTMPDIKRIMYSRDFLADMILILKPTWTKGKGYFYRNRQVITSIDENFPKEQIRLFFEDGRIIDYKDGLYTSFYIPIEDENEKNPNSFENSPFFRFSQPSHPESKEYSAYIKQKRDKIIEKIKFDNTPLIYDDCPSRKNFAVLEMYPSEAELQAKRDEYNATPYEHRERSESNKIGIDIWPEKDTEVP
jgi:hypothetical protein